MIGSWRWNVVLGIGGSILTLFFSLGDNGLAITSLRCLYAFLVFFAIAFIFRAMLAIILRQAPPALAIETPADNEQPKGQSIDYSTPDQQDELNDMLRNQLDVNAMPDPGQQFKPLSPPKLLSTQNKEPEELAKAIRHLTGG